MTPTWMGERFAKYLSPIRACGLADSERLIGLEMAASIFWTLLG